MGFWARVLLTFCKEEKVRPPTQVCQPQPVGAALFNRTKYDRLDRLDCKPTKQVGAHGGQCSSCNCSVPRARGSMEPGTPHLLMVFPALVQLRGRKKSCSGVAWPWRRPLPYGHGAENAKGKRTHLHARSSCDGSAFPTLPLPPRVARGSSTRSAEWQ